MGMIEPAQLRPPTRVDGHGRLEMLVLQPTPFCNLDCDYCYLPTRNDSRRMDFGTLDAVLWKAFSADLPAPDLTIVWHAGEPTVLPTSWYATAFARVAYHVRGGVKVRHHLQTNAVLLDAPWCEFLRRHSVQVGVSLDGPAFLHDARRKARDGKGTHAHVMAGIAQLREATVDFHVICVLTRASLAHADDLFDFFAELAPIQLCFNVEEIEACHSTSTLAADGVEQEARAFWSRFLVRMREAPTALRVREVEGVLAALRSPWFGSYARNAQNEPGRMLSVSWDGDFIFWSPELLGTRHPRLGSMALGNVLRDPLPPDSASPHFAGIQDEIDAGVARCRETCAHFDFCLGGAPANKLGERASFDAAETMHCRLSQKVVIDSVLEALDRDLPLSA